MYKVGVESWLNLRLDMSVCVVMLGMCLFAVLWKEVVDPILLSLMVAYSLQLNTVISGLCRGFQIIEGAMVSVDRLFKLLEIPQEKQTPEIPTGQFQIANRNWPREGKLEFRDVHLKYRPTTELVLKGLSFKVEPGHKVGIVGRTGAGKSTICLSISRIVELFSG